MTSPAPPVPPGRPAVRIGILAVAAVILIDALPSSCALHASLKQGVDPLVDMTGLWQGSWTLFAPNVDKQNVRLEAEVLFSDGTRALWRSPDWPRLSGWQRFVLFRHQEYYDNIRFERSRSVWPTLAQHIARTVTARNSSAVADGSAASVVRVTLMRSWADIPKLEPGKPILPAGPYERFGKPRTFYTWTPESSP